MVPQYDLGLFQGLTASRIKIQGGAMAPPCPPPADAHGTHAQQKYYDSLKTHKYVTH